MNPGTERLHHFMQGAARAEGGTPEVPAVRILRQQKVLHERRNRSLDRIHQQYPASSSVTALALLKLTDPVHRFEGVNHIGQVQRVDMQVFTQFSRGLAPVRLGAGSP